MKKLFYLQSGLLLAGTLFAWTNFGIELANWLEKKACTSGCAIGLANPFLTPCFYGAIFFLVNFIVSLITLKKGIKNNV